MSGKAAAEPREIASGVYHLKARRANVYFVSSQASWVLIDAGWPGSAGVIRAAGESLFGPGMRPSAILLTHAHPDHFGSAAELARLWELPVWVHRDDLPYLRGGILPDELLDPIGRVFNGLQRVLPRGTVARLTSSPVKDLGQALPDGATEVPGLPEWEYLHTPGHSPGHVVFFRPRDRVLIAGDVVFTAPILGLLTSLQRPARPPRVASWDWQLAKAAVGTIADLEPRVLAAGHGVPMTGVGVARDLHSFAKRFSPAHPAR
jgi:glyoxylase-like metal-dependent hydrolase (beta-lactamase superfamily II)